MYRSSVQEIQQHSHMHEDAQWCHAYATSYSGNGSVAVQCLLAQLLPTQAISITMDGFGA